jgi:hypothetical protein
MKQIQLHNNRIVALSNEMGEGEGIYTIANPSGLEVGLGVDYEYSIEGDVLTLLGIKRGVSDIARNPETFTDYKQARQEIQKLVNKQGFENLTDEEKLVACQRFAATEAQIKATIPSLQERLKAGSEFDYQSVLSRTNRLSAVKTLLYNVLTKEDGAKVIGSILKFNFETLYTKLGQEGTQSVNYKGEADEAGLYDFLQSTTAGRVAFGYVLEDLGIVPLEGFTLETLVERCMDILENGNY